MDAEKFVNCAKCPVSAFCDQADTMSGHQIGWYRPSNSTPRTDKQTETYYRAVERLEKISEVCPLRLVFVIRLDADGKVCSTNYPEGM